jgi:protein phosphatase
MESDASAFRALFHLYSTALLGVVSLYAKKEMPLILPRPDPSVLTRLFRHTASIFECEPTLLEISSPCIIIGDIHGQILDLFRILNTFPPPGRTTYLFLGDIVDRGEFSVECVICVFLLKSLWPDRTFLIRGNHEFSAMCSHCGFMSQMMEFFQDGALYQDVISAFSQIPLAARVDDSILCVHGGLGPNLVSLASIASLRRPIDDFGDDVLDSLVWSDPDPNVELFEESTIRGLGYAFGESAAVSFLDEAKLSVLVRAHECVPDGAKEMFGGRVLTLFSASNYCGLKSNDAAVLEVAPGTRRVRHLPPIAWITRSSATFSNDAAQRRFQKDTFACARSPQPKAKGVWRMPSEGLLPIMSKTGPARFKACESLRDLREITSDVVPASPPLIAQAAAIRTFKPVVKTKWRRFLPNSA